MSFLGIYEGPEHAMLVRCPGARASIGDAVRSTQTDSVKVTIPFGWVLWLRGGAPLRYFVSRVSQRSDARLQPCCRNLGTRRVCAVDMVATLVNGSCLNARVRRTSRIGERNNSLCHSS
jgi:hypothetical protein